MSFTTEDAMREEVLSYTSAGVPDHTCELRARSNMVNQWVVWVDGQESDVCWSMEDTREFYHVHGTHGALAVVGASVAEMVRFWLAEVQGEKEFPPGRALMRMVIASGLASAVVSSHSGWSK
jgi:hypothetical protein